MAVGIDIHAAIVTDTSMWKRCHSAWQITLLFANGWVLQIHSILIGWLLQSKGVIEIIFANLNQAQNRGLVGQASS
ncbi:hypothetical protein ACEN9F_02135 [Duganella sp. CT11-25]|uniref:hypothetical protein n=1 Tax=unclassified Duganella TaxID=2636909 RepID=UPI0039B010C1